MKNIKFLGILLAIIVAPFYARSAGNSSFDEDTEYTSGVLKFDLNLQTLEAEVSGYTQMPSGDLIIPETLSLNDKTFKVTSIKHGVFQRCPITSISIPPTLKFIGNDAFAFCSSYDLTKVFITDLSAWCNIDFEDNPLLVAGHLYLNGEEITELEIPGDITEIKANTFIGFIAMTELTIPETVMSIGAKAFAYCRGLKTLTIPDSVKEIGEGAFIESGLVTVDTGNGVETLGRTVFESCKSLTQITLGESLNEIGEAAFRSCGYLSGITIPDKVTEIRRATFSGCTNLHDVVLGSGITSLGDNSFFNNRLLKTIDLPEGLIEIGKEAFNGCKNLETVSFGSSLGKIGGGAFYECERIKNIELPETIIEIGEGAFSYCKKMTHAKIGTSLEKLGAMSFYGCTDLISVNIPDKVTVIEESTFYGCTNLKNVEWSKSLVTIKDKAFYICYDLNEIDLPETLVSIGDYAFGQCKRVTGLTCRALTPPECGNRCFYEMSVEDCPLYVPEESLEVYKSTAPWSEFLNIRSISDAGIFSVEDNANIVFPVFDLKGQKVRNDNNPESVKSLPKGIYIINGRKVLL